LLQFSAPIWLFAMAAIAAPVIIHLWNNRHGKKLKIGSIAFLQESAVRRTKRNFISEWLLLALRCILFILLAFLLAQPVLKKDINADIQKGWLLIDKTNASETYSHFKITIDSLLQKGYELHSFNRKFEKLSVENISEKETKKSDPSIIQYRLLYTMLDQTAPASIPVYIFSTNDLLRYKGEVPMTSREVKWMTYTKPDSESKWIANAYFTQPDSIHVIKALSNPVGTKFIHEEIENAPGKKSDYDVTLANGNVGISTDNQKPVAVDTSSLRITIYADKFANDAAYLKAAIESIQKFTQRKIRLYIAGSLQNFPQKQDWLFWLSDNKMPSDISSENFFEYNTEKASVANTWMETGNQDMQAEKISLAKYSGSSEKYQSPEMIWKDGFGKPVLLGEKKDEKMYYHFYSHFDPSWNGLVWSNSFPSLLMNLFFSNERINKNDKRAIDNKQVQPIFQEAKNKSTKNYYTEDINLNNILWIFLFLIFVVERIISFKAKKGAVYA